MEIFLVLDLKKENLMSILNNFNGLFLFAITALSYLAISKNTQGDKEHFIRVHKKD